MTAGAAATLGRFAAHLSSRGVVRVAGLDAVRFLQGLVTCDIHALCGEDAARASAAAFLNGRGRVVFGTLIARRAENEYLVDLPAERAANLVGHLKRFRLRAMVDIDDASAEFAVWSVVGAALPEISRTVGEGGIVFDDPRLPALGVRAITEGAAFVPPPGIAAADESSYTALRVLSGVPDGDDFNNIPLPLDLALHLLNGVSFNKGCYLGQELTARSHFTGVLRKRLTPFVVTQAGEAPPSATVLERVAAGDADAYATILSSTDSTSSIAAGTELQLEGKKRAAATVTSSTRNVGLAVLRLEDVFGSGEARTLSLRDGRVATPWQPAWWAERSEDAVRAPAP